METKREELEQKVYDFTKMILGTGEFDGADIVLDCGVIDFYKGINCYTLTISDGDSIALVFSDKAIAFNRTISSRQLEMLEQKPNLFLQLDSRYFMDNENLNEFSQDKANKLIRATSKGLERMPKSAEKVELQKNIMSKVEKIKKETTINL